MQLDFLDPSAPDKLKAMLGGPADVVLSDMAANATGHAKTDHLKIMALVETAADFAREVLRPGGSFLAKVLQGGTEARAARHAQARLRQRQAREAGGEPCRLGRALSVGDGLPPLVLMPRAFGPDVGEEQAAGPRLIAAAQFLFVIGAAARLLDAGVIAAALGLAQRAPAAVALAGGVHGLLVRSDGELAGFRLLRRHRCLLDLGRRRRRGLGRNSGGLVRLFCGLSARRNGTHGRRRRGWLGSYLGGFFGGGFGLQPLLFSQLLLFLLLL